MNRKAALIVMSLALSAASGAAFAQSTAQPGEPAQNAGATDSSQTSAQWTSPDDTHSTLTRAQVEQDYQHAKDDGQLAYLNKTVYAHH